MPSYIDDQNHFVPFIDAFVMYIFSYCFPPHAISRVRPWNKVHFPIDSSCGNITAFIQPLRIL